MGLRVMCGKRAGQSRMISSSVSLSRSCSFHHQRVAGVLLVVGAADSAPQAAVRAAVERATAPRRWRRVTGAVDGKVIVIVVMPASLGGCVGRGVHAVCAGVHAL